MKNEIRFWRSMIFMFVIFTIMLLYPSISSATEEIYMRAFGSAGDPAVIFLHGGPGYNCFLFEAAAAETLSKTGLFVIVFDQRGCGRSKSPKADYTFSEAIADLDSIYKRAGVKKACLTGHSFGAAVALKFAAKYPEKVSSIILAGAPLDYPAGFKAIINNCRKVYAKKNTEFVAQMDLVEKLDPASIEYLNLCFMHAMSCGLYNPSKLTPEAEDIKKSVSKDKNYFLASKSEFLPVAGFLAKERYSTLDHTSSVVEIVKTIPVYGIYGAEDGLFDEACLEKIKSAVGEKNFMLVQGASHNIFRDQRAIFCDFVKKYASH